ncbi:unnamed protein product, partial [Gulo gulo]
MLWLGTIFTFSSFSASFGDSLISLLPGLSGREAPAQTLSPPFHPAPRIQAPGRAACSAPVRFPHPTPILLPAPPPSLCCHSDKRF